MDRQLLIIGPIEAAYREGEQAVEVVLDHDGGPARRIEDVRVAVDRYRFVPLIQSPIGEFEEFVAAIRVASQVAADGGLDMPGETPSIMLRKESSASNCRGGGREVGVAGDSLQSYHRPQVGLAAAQDANVGLDVVIGRGTAAAAADLAASGRRAARTKCPRIPTRGAVSALGLSA